MNPALINKPFQNKKNTITSFQPLKNTILVENSGPLNLDDIMDSEEDDSGYISGGDGDDRFEEVSGGDGGGDTEEKHYKILKEEDIRQLQEEHISTVSSLLSVSRGSACALLCRKNWNLSLINDEFEITRAAPDGILGKRSRENQVCSICYEEICNEKMVSGAVCGHLFCVDCWNIYLTTSINDGLGCLTLRCPEPKCRETVGLDIVDRFVSGDDRDKYYKYLNRFYVECDNKNRKWCPSPGCDLAIEIVDCDCEYCDVTCDCSYKFCWKCTQESHRPVSCETVANWLEKNSSEAENTKWILAYTKPCPKCKKSIEKNQGCNHMTCERSCGFQFCWICLSDWRRHDCMKCNKFREGEGGSRDGMIRMNAKKHLERYTHYYERWDSNDKSRKRALGDLNQARNEHIPTLNEVQGYAHGQLAFVTEAWEQIAECRRVLKWTYAYGYYLSLDENSSKKINLFEYLQGEAEAALERLHHCAEKEMDKYLKSLYGDFKDFRAKLSDLTVITRNYFENLVRGLENNLSEVESC